MEIIVYFIDGGIEFFMGIVFCLGVFRVISFVLRFLWVLYFREVSFGVFGELCGGSVGLGILYLFLGYCSVLGCLFCGIGASSG